MLKSILLHVTSSPLRFSYFQKILHGPDAERRQNAQEPLKELRRDKCVAQCVVGLRTGMLILLCQGEQIAVSSAVPEIPGHGTRLVLDPGLDPPRIDSTAGPMPRPCSLWPPCSGSPDREKRNGRPQRHPSQNFRSSVERAADSRFVLYVRGRDAVDEHARRGQRCFGADHHVQASFPGGSFRRSS